jgi:hypothetical protein
VTTIETAVMLLAAGRSTRLGPLGLALPKPLAPICGYPPIRFGLAACARAGFREVVINLHHLGDRLRETLGDSEGGLRIRYSVEVELLGTGGGIAHARGLLGPGRVPVRVLVINGKVVADVDLREFLGSHVESGAEASLLLRDDPDPRKWGAIGVDATGRVVSILTARSPIPPEGPVTERMFTGIHLMEPALLDRLRPQPCDVIRDARGRDAHRRADAGRLLRRALDTGALPGREPGFAAQPVAGAAPARAADRHSADGTDCGGAVDRAVSDWRGRRGRCGRGDRAGRGHRRAGEDRCDGARAQRGGLGRHGGRRRARPRGRDAGRRRVDRVTGAE